MCPSFSALQRSCSSVLEGTGPPQSEGGAAGVTTQRLRRGFYRGKDTRTQGTVNSMAGWAPGGKEGNWGMGKG